MERSQVIKELERQNFSIYLDEGNLHYGFVNLKNDRFQLWLHSDIGKTNLVEINSDDLNLEGLDKFIKDLKK